MNLKFFYAPMSTASLTHVVLEELGVPYEKVKLDFKAGDTKKPAFLALNPNGKVPVLVDGDTPIFESLAILLHLGETYGVTRGLWPELGTTARIEAYSWSAWGSVSVTSVGYKALTLASQDKPEAQRTSDDAKAAVAAFEGLVGLLDTRLENRKFVVGGAFSLVDSHLATTFSWIVRGLGLDVSRFASFAEWLKASTSRPAVQRTFAG